MAKKELLKKSMVFLVLLLLINLPIVYAVETSGLNETSEVNEPADANEPVETNETEVVLDTEIPEIEVSLSSFIRGNRLTFSGTTELNAEVNLFVNDLLLKTVVAIGGSFEFSDIFLQENKANQIRLEVVDLAGNINSFSGIVFADTQKPVINLSEIPEYVEDNSFVIKVPISEIVNLEIFVNNRSVSKGEGVSEIDKSISLDEGINQIKIVLVDQANWETVEEFSLISDTKPPQVSFEFEKGSEYYEGRAETDIHGKTEPGIAVYLYVFRGFGDEYKMDFKRAIAKTTSNEEGEFTFKEVSFPPSPFDRSVKELAPKEIPPGLQEVLIPLSQLSSEQKKSFKIYVLAEDKSGKSGYAQKTVNINTCYSANQDFGVTLIPEFQAPFKLDPGLMEDGRESIQSVFNISYQGDAIAPLDVSSNKPKEAYKISTVSFQKACTQAMADDDEFKYGCMLAPSTLTAQHNSEKTSYYVTANLNRASDFINTEDNVWDDFQKRQLKIPLRVTINYQERNAEGSWDQRKTQTFCYDLGYFVDIPIESKDMIPDFLAEEGVDALNWTLEQIQMLKPYLETAMLVAGISCVGSFLIKMIARFYRNFMINFEPWLTKWKPGNDEACPDAKGQQQLYLDETINHWKNDLSGHPDLTLDSAIPELDAEKDSLDKRCPSTASAWKVESYIDLAYRFTCDRFFCRSVPAGWTQEATEKEIKDVVAEQKMCAAASGSCSFLEEIENCQKKLDYSPANKIDADAIILEKGHTFPCYRNNENGLLYTVVGNQEQELEKRIWTLTPTSALNGVGIISPSDLIAYKPDGSDQMCVAKKIKCESECKRKSGYKATNTGYNVDDGIESFGPQNGACYKEETDGNSIVLRGSHNELLKDGRVAAGYTKDCFVNVVTEEKYQCVCEPDEKAVSTGLKGAREAVRKVGEQEEKWIYRQDQIFADSKGRAGTKYSKLRYYSGRDFSGAFGASYGLDNFRDKDFKETEVNPRTQLLGTFQSVCIPGIYARLQLLESILIGLRNCLIEAKYTGFQDAGMCKTIFTQYVCSLIYKGISYLASDCSPISFSDAGKEGAIGGVEAFFAAGTKAIPQTLDSSIRDVKSDYGNAHLDQFFASGSQGFAESLCLAAFGYDFPMDMDFIMDAAYAFSTSTNVIFPIAERELSTFDPIKGTAVFNYHLAGTILPGCQIRSYRTTLKCVGPNDFGKAGVDCTQQTCDCMNVAADQSVFESQKSKVVQGGVGTSLTKGQMFDMPIPSPQKVSSPYRYDHVVLELNLAQGEDPEQCFDKEYRTSNGGLFYFPIRDISPPALATCQVSANTGRFSCPKLTDFFASGQSYFEHPFMRCLNEKTGEYVKCDTPNLFIKDDKIIIKPYLNLGKSKTCLKIETSDPSIDPPPRPLPEDLTGSYSPPITLGDVSETMITGGNIGTIVPVKGSYDPGCAGNELDVRDRPGDDVKLDTRKIKFSYLKRGDEYQLKAETDNVGLKNSDNYQILKRNGIVASNSDDDKTFFSYEDLNKIEFTYKGFSFVNALGRPVPSEGEGGQCTYEARFARAGSAGVGSLQVTLKLLQPVGDDCFKADTLIPTGSLGSPKHTEKIRIQSESVEETYARGMEDDFFNQNYENVVARAEGIVKRNENSLSDAQAFFYWIASYVMQADGLVKHKNQILSLLNEFFQKDYGDVKKTGEFQKINTYLCCVADNIGSKENYPPCNLIQC